MLSCSVLSDSLGPNELWPTRLLCAPCTGSPGKNTGAGSHAFLQVNLPDRRSELVVPVSLAWQAGSLLLELGCGGSNPDSVMCCLGDLDGNFSVPQFLYL